MQAIGAPSARWRIDWQKVKKYILTWCAIGLGISVWQGLMWVPSLFLDEIINVPSAYARARAIRAFERLFGIPDSLYKLGHGPHWTAAYEYPHLVVMFCLVPCLMVARADKRIEVLSMVALMTMIGLVIWSLFPVAPPWMLLKGGAMPVNSGIAQYCSTPSYHVAYAALVARYTGMVGRLYALFMIVCVVITGNHYVVDVLAGMALYLSASMSYDFLAQRVSSHLPCWIR